MVYIAECMYGQHESDGHKNQCAQQPKFKSSEYTSLIWVYDFNKCYEIGLPYIAHCYIIMPVICERL